MVDMMMQAGVNPWAEIERQARRAYAAEKERDELRARLENEVMYPQGWASSTEHPLGTREHMAKAGEGRHPSTSQILMHFAWAHLPEKLQSYSRVMADLALQMVGRIPDGPELTAGLRKLLEAKDCFVRAAIDKE